MLYTAWYSDEYYIKQIIKYDTFLWYKTVISSILTVHVHAHNIDQMLVCTMNTYMYIW